MRNISLQQLEELTKSGAKIKVDDKPVKIDGLESIIQVIKQMFMMMSEQNIAHSAEMSEMRKAVSSIANAINEKQPQSLSRVEGLLSSVVMNTSGGEKPMYEFDIQRRTRDDRMLKVIAKPISRGSDD